MPASFQGHALYYNDSLVTNLQLRWGDGFLSPGGRDELLRMFQGVDVKGRLGLDLGCGVGGYDVNLVRDLGARKVIGVDLGAAVVEEAIERSRREGVAEKLEFIVVEPGPLPFEDETFDFAFTKDSIADIPLAEKPGAALGVSSVEF